MILWYREFAMDSYQWDLRWRKVCVTLRGRSVAMLLGLSWLCAQGFAEPVGREDNPDLDAMQQLAGWQVPVRVIRFAPARQFPGLVDPFDRDGGGTSVAIVRIRDALAIVLPGQTTLREGASLRLNLIPVRQVAPRAGSGLPNPLPVYREAFRHDVQDYRIAWVEEAQKTIDTYRQRDFLSQYTLPRELASDIPSEWMQRGLVSPLHPRTRYLFTPAPAVMVQVVQVARLEGHFEVRLIHPETRGRLVVLLPGDSRSRLLTANPGSMIRIDGFIELLTLGPQGVERGQLFERESDFADYLWSVAQVMAGNL